MFIYKVKRFLNDALALNKLRYITYVSQNAQKFVLLGIILLSNLRLATRIQIKVLSLQKIY